MKIKNYLKELKGKIQESKNSDIIITKDSTKEEVSYFLKNKFNFSQRAIESLDLDGKILFSLEENDIDDVDELNDEEKIKFKNYLKKQKFEQNKKSENINSKKETNPGKKNESKKQIVDIKDINKIKEFENKYKISFDKLRQLLGSIIYFIEAFNKVKQIQMTNLINELKLTYDSLQSNEINEEYIKNTINLLLQNNYDITKESYLIQFFEIFFHKDESLLFLKKINDTNFDIRNFYELIEDKNYLKTSYISNLIYVYKFVNNLMDNQEIKTDKDLLLIFQKKFYNEKDIMEKFKLYLYVYRALIELYQAYNECTDPNIQIINQLLKESIVNIYKEKKLDKFIYKIVMKTEYGEKREINFSEIEELKNKILISNNKISKIKKFLNIIGNINALINILNVLHNSGYPSLTPIILNINNSEVLGNNDENGENIIKRKLKILIEYYDEINDKFKKAIKIGYENYPFFRLFYGKQLKKLFKRALNKRTNIFHLVNSVTMNKVKNFNIKYIYDIENYAIENINKFLEKLFKINGISLDDFYNNNKIKENIGLTPGLYRKVKYCSNSEYFNMILNIYLNLTGNFPLINTILICNEETSKEKIKSFLYRALFCKNHILFVIVNLEYLESTITQYFFETLKILYEEKRNNINSYILFLYEKKDTIIMKEIETLIPEKNILDSSFLNPSKEKKEEFQKIEVYSSKFAGYGKTTNIKYKIKNLGGKYNYLPIRGSISRNDIINLFEKQELDLNNGKSLYLHIDLSETDNEDLMNEILFKLIILRYIDSKEKIFYLGNDIHLIIEIPNSFIELDKKYKILNLFKKIYIDKLNPLRLEENIKFIKDSPISIVAEVLSLYEHDEIDIKNIDLYSPVKKSAEECEKIINKYLKEENQNYYTKMNFIKILSFLFIKFTNNFYLNYKYTEYNCNKNKIKIIRKALIKNFIKLAKDLTHFPFFTLEKQRQNILAKYYENEVINEEINFLSNENKDIFNLEKIKSNLVLVNKDGESLSIISNSKKNESENKILKSLYNLQNYNSENSKDLIDYKNLNLESILNQIKILFSLDRLSINAIKQLCVNLGNFIFVPDNFIKIALILLKIEAKVPVILMGDTGTGKTKLLEMFATLYNKGINKMKTIKLHSDINDEQIIEFIKLIEKEIKNEGREDELTLILFDKINNCNCLELIKEIFCNHTYLGNKINDNFIFLGTCSPYRILTKKMKESNSIYYNNISEINNLSNKLFYSVNPLPYSLFNFVFDFDSLEAGNEKSYIKNRFLLKLNDLNTNDKIQLINEIIDSVIVCHGFIREKYDKSSISLRDINRFGILYEYFFEYFKRNNSTFQSMKSSLNLTLYLCYYLRLDKKDYKEELLILLNPFFNNNFLSLPEYEIRLLTNQMLAERGIILNRALAENLFTSFICIENNIPLIIIGKPGMGKSLGFKILYNTLKGEFSESDLFKDKGMLYRYYYQGSSTNTMEGIISIFVRANKSKINEKKQIISLVYFDNMNLAERAFNNPLQIIPYYLENNYRNSIPFIGTTINRLNEDIMNNALNLAINDYDIEELEEIAISITESLDLELANRYQYFFKTLARTYHEYITFNKNYLNENRDFHGINDFYPLIKIAMRELIKKRNNLIKNEDNILTKTAILSLNVNFGGLENSSKVIKKIFKKEYTYKFDEKIDENKPFPILDAIKRNILDKNSRYLMLISEGNNGSDIVKYILDLLQKKYIELIGSKFKELKEEIYLEKIINKIKYIMETDNVLILRDLDIIFPSLYDLFGQNFTILGEKKFVRIVSAYSTISSEVNKDFRCIVIINKNELDNKKLDTSFLNKFEKHIINFSLILNDKDIEIAKRISEYLENIISSYYNEKNLESNYEKLLINYDENFIEGLLFKIKQIIGNKGMEKNINNEEYENMIVKLIFKKIAPTFYPNIINYLTNIINNLDVKYKEINEILIEIYTKSHYANFENFLENLNSKRNIIYTFSNIIDNEFHGEKNIKNEFGIFNKQNTIIKHVQSIKEENEVISILKIFLNKENTNMLIWNFSEKEFNKINYIDYIINDFQKTNSKLNEKIIIFIIYMNKLSKNEKIKIDNSDLISSLNYEYEQVFIDDLKKGK